MDIMLILRSVGGWLAGNGLRIILIGLIALLLVRGFGTLSARYFRSVLEKKHKGDGEFEKRTNTLSSILNYVVHIAVITIASAMVIRELGIDIGPILAAAGVLGLAVGFGAQSLVKDLISGFFLILEDQIRVGDVVDIAGKAGIVERMNLKMTILRDVGGNVHFIPNGQIDVVTNMTREYSRYVFDIGVAYREDVDEVMEIMRNVDESIRQDPDFQNDVLEPMEIFGLDRFADSALIIKARATTRPLKQWRYAREFNRRLKKVFDERGIEIPFPHVTLYMGQQKDGGAPPVRVMRADQDRVSEPGDSA